MTVLFSLFDNEQLTRCVTDGHNRDAVISDAEDYFCTRAEEDSEYGAGERDAWLLSYDEDTEEEKVERITLSWHAEKDDYDGGRFDYLAGIGAIRSF